MTGGRNLCFFLKLPGTFGIDPQPSGNTSLDLPNTTQQMGKKHINVLRFWSKTQFLKDTNGCYRQIVYLLTMPWAVCYTSHKQDVTQNPRVDQQMSLIFKWPKWGIYPLVNCHITMENHHFQRVNPL